MRAITNNIPEFEIFLTMIPKELRDLVEQTKRCEQRADYHPEIWVYDHIKIIYNKARKLGRFDLCVVALFHDLGKLTTSRKHYKHDYITSPGHEDESAKLVIKYSDWITSLGLNPDYIYFLVSQHMRVHQIDSMRKSKQEILRSNPYFNDLLLFSKLDDMLNKDY